ncbi:unnamed protein product [Vitrella brassicaformis CCMP3155]|uniref:Uncharacterized protein n=4 Tax=Vitrella brassicaformis TaxID=1169539 RepID=A0A0G4EXZ1_VITBC|nr:unnamed protein product [Vitrella brassicaformis CCMP3155]|eukprot:CEM03489.1 unnamed protein product [Vitrella brassicaformis CCMP3155]
MPGLLGAISPLSVNINIPLTAIQNVYLLDCHYAGRVIEALDQCHGPQAILVTPTAAPGSTLWGGRIRRPSADGLLVGGGDMSSTGGTPLAATRTSPVEEGSYYAFGACGSDQRLTVHERTPFPVDYFTSCMTSPVRAALAFYAAKGNRLTSHIDAKLLDDIPGRIDQRNTPLGELQWILTSITEAIAWNTFDLALFQQLHRTDPAIATLFRNFLVANRILRSLGLTPVSRPVLPDTHLHPLWDVWDAVAEHVVLQLPTLMQHPETAEANYRPSAFYEQQMLAFSVWLRGSDRDDTTTPHHHLPPFSQHMINQPVAASAAGLTPMRRPSVSDQQPGFDMGGLAESAFAHQLLAPPPRPPEQLPILLQSLLRQRGRAETLRLMTVYLDMGPWAVRCALIVGLVPYLTQLLSRPAVPTDVRELIILLWSKFLAYDPSCRKEVLQAGLHRHFINYIAEGRSPVHRAFACICIAILCRDYPLPESDDDVPTARGAQLVVVNEGGLQACAAVLSHRADPLAFLRRSAALAMAEMCRNFPEAQERVLASGWHTRLLEGLDDHRPEVRACFVCAVASLLYPLLDPQYQYQCEREMQESAMDVRNAPVGSIGWAPGLPQQPPASGAMAATGSPPFSAVSIPSPKDATALPSAVLQTPPGLRASAAPQQVMRAISGRPPVMRNSSSGDSTTTGQQTPLSTPMANQRGGHGNQLMPPDSSDSLRRQGSGGSTAAFARSRSDHNQPPVGLSGGQGPSAGPGAGMGRARSGTGDFLQDNPSLKSMTLLGVRLEKAPPLRLMSPAPGGRTVSSEWVGADGGDTPTLSPMETRSHSIAGQTFGSAVVDADSHARDMAAALRWREELCCLTHLHPLWDVWDAVAEHVVLQLPTLMQHPETAEANYRPSAFYEQQMLAFSVWLRGSDGDDTTTPHHHLPPFSQHMINQPVAASAAGLTPMRRPSVSDQQPGDMGGLAESAFAHQLLAPPPRPPEQLPILLQRGRAETLRLMTDIEDMGPWAVRCALIVGLVPYLTQLLSRPAVPTDVRELIILLWSKFLAYDPSCRKEVLQAGLHRHFVNYIAEGRSPVHRAFACICIAVLCRDYPLPESDDDVPTARGAQLVVVNEGGLQACTAVLSHRADPLAFLRRSSALAMAETCRNFPEAQERVLASGWHTRLLEGLDDHRPEVRACFVCAVDSLLYSLLDPQYLYQCEKEMQESAMDVRNALTPPGLRASAAPQQVMRAISGRPPVMRNSSSGDSITTGQQTPLSTPMANQRGGHGNQLMPPDSSDSLRRQGSGGGSSAAFARSRSDHNQPPVGLSGGQGPSAGPGAGMGRARSGTGDFLQDNPSLKSMTLLGVRLEKAPPLRLMSPAPGGRTVSSEWVGADGGDTPTLSPMETRSHSIAGQTFGAAVVDADSHARDMAAALRWREELVERMCGHFLCSGIGSPPPSPYFGLDAGRDNAATTFASSPENDILRESSLLVKHELVCALAPIMWESWCEAHSTALRTPRALVRPGAVGPLTESVTTAAGKSGGSDETVSAASSVATSHSSVLSAGPPAILTDADTPPVGPMASPTHTSVPYSLRSRVMVLLWRDGSTLISHMCRRSVVAAQMVIARQKQEQAAEALQRMAAQPGAEDADSDESEPSNYARALSPEFPSPTAAPPMQRTPPLSSRLPPRVAETLEGIDEAILPPLSASAKDWAGQLASSGCVSGRVGGVHRAQRHSFMGAVGIAEEGESTESEGNTPKSDSKKAAKPSGGFSTFLKSLQSMMLPKHMRVATTTPLHDQPSSLGWSHIDRSASLSLDPTTFTIDRSPVAGSEGGQRCALPRPSSARLLVPQQTIGGGMGRGAGPPRLTSRPTAPLLRRNSQSEGDFESGGGPQARMDEAVADGMGLDEDGNCTLPASQVFQWTIALLLRPRTFSHPLFKIYGSPPPCSSHHLAATADDEKSPKSGQRRGNDILRESSLLVKHELVCALAPIMWESWCEAHSTALRTPRALVRPGAVGPLTDSVTTAAGKSGGSDETVSAASSVATSHSSVLSAGPPAIVTDADTPPVGPMASPTHTSVPYSLRSRVMVLLWRDGSTLISHMCRRSVVAAQMVIARQKQEQAAEALQRMAAQPGAEDADSDESEPSNYARALSPEFPSPTAAPPMQRTPPLSSRLPPRVAETLEGIDEAVLPPLSASAKDWCFGCRHHMPHHRSTFHTHSAGALASSGCVAAGRVGGVHRAQRHSFMGAVGIAEEGESTESEGNTPKSDSKKAAKPSGGFSTFLKSLQSMMLPKHMRVATTTPLHDQPSSLGWSHIDRSASLSLDPTTFTIDRSPVAGSEGGQRCALPRPSSARLLVPQQTIGGGMGRGAGPPRLTSRPTAPLLRRNSQSEGDFESGGGPQARMDEAVADGMGLDEDGNCTLPASQVFQWTIALLLRPRTFSHPLFKIYGSPPPCSSHHLAATADDEKSPKSGQRRGVHCHHHHHHHHHRRQPQGDSSPRAAGGEQPSVVREPPAVHHLAPPRLFQPVPEPCHVSRCASCMFHQVGLRKGDKTPHYCRGLFPPTSCEYVLLPTPPAEPFGQQPRKPRGSPMIKRASREREPTSASAATLKVERVAESSKTLPGPPGSREWRRAQSSSPQARPLEPRPLAVVMPSPAAKHAAAPSPIPLPPRQVSPLPGDLRASRDIDVTEVRPISLPTAAPHSSGGGASSSLSQPAPSFPSSQRLSSHENSDSESSSSSSSGSSVVHFFRVAVCGQCFADEIPAGGDYVEHSSVPLPGIDMEVSGARKGVVGAGALLDWLGVTHHPTCLLFHPSRPLLLVGQALGTLQVFDYSSSPAVCRRVVNVFATHKGSARSGCPWHLEPQAGAQQTGPLRLARSSAQGPPSLLTYVSLYPPRILQRLGDDMRAVSGSPQSMKQQRSPSLIPAALTRSFSAQHTVMAATASPLAGSFVSATGSPPVYGSVAGTNPPPMGLPPQAQMGPDGRRDSLAEQFDALKGDRRQLGMNSQAMFGPGELPGYPDWGNQGGLAIGHPYGCKTCGAAHPSFTDLAFVNEHAHLPPPQDDIACQVIGGFDDGTVRLCRFWTDTANHQKPLVVATWQALPPKRQTGLRLSFRQRSGRLVAGGRDPLVRVWDVRQGRCVGSFPHGGAASSHVTCLHQPVGDPDAPIDSLTPSQPLSAFHPDIATGNSDGSVTLIDSRADGSRARGAGRDPLLYHRSAILTMSAGIPGQPFQLITADTSASVALWDIRKKNTVLRAYQLGTVSKGPPAAPNLTPPTPSLTGRELSPRSMLPPLASSTADSLTAGPSSTSTASHAVLSADIHPFHSSIGWSGSKGDMVISSSVGGDTLQRWTLRRKMRGTTVKWHPVKAVMGVVGEGGGPGGGALVYRAAKEKISPDR